MKILPLFLLLAWPQHPVHSQDSSRAGGRDREATLRDGESLAVNLAVADASKNLLTAVVFPNEIAQIVSAWNPKDLSVEHEGRRLFLKLLSKTEGHLDVLLASGLHVRLLLVPSTRESADSHVAVRMIEVAAERRRSGDGASSAGALELIRSMRLGESPGDAVIRAGKGEIVFSSTALEARLVRVYETGRFSGFVVEVVNKAMTEAYHLDLTTFEADRLVLAGSKDVILKPNGSTQLYLVFWK